MDSKNESGPEESKRHSSTTRRSVLSSVAVASVGVGGLTGVSSAAGTGVEPLDTSFDPSDDSAVREFTRSTFAWSNRHTEDEIRAERTRLLESLTDEQLLAVSDVIDGAELVVTPRKPDAAAGDDASTAIRSEDPIGTQSISCTEYTYPLDAYLDTIVGTYHAFTYSHEIDWCYDGTDCWNIEPRGYGDGNYYVLAYWNYLGDTGDDVYDGGTYFQSERTGSFEGCILVDTSFTCPRRDYGYSKLVGDMYGNHAVADTDVYGT